MKRHLMFIVMAVVLSMLPGTAMADSIKGKLGVTGRMGFMVASDSELTTVTGYTIVPSVTIDLINGGEGRADTVFAGGGGFIYGISDELALEVDVIHTPEITYRFMGQDFFEITSTDVSLGVQYRVIPESRFVPYFGAGVDVIVSDGKYLGRDKLNIETVVGGHLNAGADVFITKHIALNADFREILAPNAEINYPNPPPSYYLRDGKYDPISFVGLFGIRYFFN